MERSIYRHLKNNEFKIKQKEQPHLFKYKIVRMFNCRAEAILFESFMHHYFDVKSHFKFINDSNQTPFGFDTTGKILVKDSEGNIFLIENNNSFDTLIPINTNKIPVIDNNDNRFQVDVNDPLFLNGDVTHHRKGKWKYFDERGFEYYLDVNDPIIYDKNLNH